MFDDLKLPSRIGVNTYRALVATIADALTHGGDPVITDALDTAELQPTSRAAMLAAQAAVSVLLAHEIGQEVGQDAGQRSGYLDALADNAHVFDIAEAATAKQQPDDWPGPEA